MKTMAAKLASRLLSVFVAMALVVVAIYADFSFSVKGITETAGVLFNFDTVPAGASGTIESTGQREGTGWFKQTLSPGAQWNFIANSDNIVDASDLSNPALHFWAYIDNVAKFGEITYFLLDSNNEAVSGYVHAHCLVNGWNEITIPLQSSGDAMFFGQYMNISVSEAFNFSEIRGFKCLTSPTDSVVFGLDCMEIIDEPKDTGNTLFSFDFIPKDTPMYPVVGHITDTVDKKEGSGSQKMTLASVGMGEAPFLATSTNIIDASAMTRPALRFWMYVENAAAIKGSDFEYFLYDGTNTNADKMVTGWLRTRDLMDGWNEITLPLDNITADTEALRLYGHQFTVSVGANFDFTKIKGFGMKLYNYAGYTGVLGLDDMKVIDLSPEPNNNMLVSFDNLFPGMSYNSGYSIDRTDKKQGDGAIKWNITGAENWLLGTTSLSDGKTVDASAINTPALHFWVYVEDATNFVSNDFYYQLHNSTNDKLITGILHAQYFVSGWNEIIIPLINLNDYIYYGQKFSVSVDPDFDFSKINGLGLLIYHNAPYTSGFGLDGIEIIDLPTDSGNTLFSFDFMPSGYTEDGKYSISTDDPKQGTGWFKQTVAAAENLDFVGISTNTVNAGEMERPALHFWVYFNDITQLNGELTVLTGKTGEGNRAIIYVHRAHLENGWNEVTIPLTGATGDQNYGGQFFGISREQNFDVSSIEYFHVLASSSGAMVYGLDGVEIIDLGPDTTPKDTGNTLFSFDFMPSGYTEDSKYSISTDDPKQGTGWFKQTVAAAENLNLTLNSTNNIDASGITKPALHFWLYLSDRKNISGDITMLLGKDFVEGNRAVIYLHTTNLVTGWNEITIPLGDVSLFNKENTLYGQKFFITPEANFNLNELCSLMLMASSTGALEFGLDGMEIVSLASFDPDKPSNDNPSDNEIPETSVDDCFMHILAAQIVCGIVAVTLKRRKRTSRV